MAAEGEKNDNATITIGSLLSVAVHALTLATAAASFAYSYGTANTNIQHLEQGRAENRAAIQQLQVNDNLITSTISDLRVAVATLNQQIVALRSDIDQLRRANNGRVQ